MKKIKKITALVLAAVMLLMVFALPAAAAEANAEEGYSFSETFEHKFYGFLDKLVHAIVKILNFIIPGYNLTGKWQSIGNYTPEYFYAGSRTFTDTAEADAVWSAGYSSASLIDGLDIMNGEYFLAGTLEAFTGRAPTTVVDDQRVNVFTLSDGSGIYAHAVIDGFGFSRGNVIEIRKQLDEFAKANNIVSLNVSVLHQHSCIDTLGMACPLVPAVLKNPVTTVTGGTVVKGKNDTFMNNLYAKTVACVKEAVNGMKEGSLYFGTVDASDYIKDKREPIVFDGNISRLRFVPADSSANELWICEAGIHCTSLGAGPSELTSDFPYYIKQYVKENNGADLVWVQGAELAITILGDKLSYAQGETDLATDVNKMKAIGKALGDRIISISNDKALSPVLNIAFKEVNISADNQIQALAVREGILDPVVVKDGLGYTIVTELGYMELGNEVAVILIPGEMAPEIVWGGAVSKEASWTGDTWNFASMQELCKKDTVICFGLVNDQIGYILTDNDYRSMFQENEEVNASSFTSGSTLVRAFGDLMTEIGK